MNIEKLTEILELSALYWKSNGKEGKKANLRDANLRSANLRGANLSDAEIGGGSTPIDPSIFGLKADPELPIKIAKAIIEPSALDMGAWHHCNTTHCLAGWAIHLSGFAGYALESITSPSVAGAMLLPSASHLFYSNNESAIEWANEVIKSRE
jgi:hypothetical protein